MFATAIVVQRIMTVATLAARGRAVVLSVGVLAWALAVVDAQVAFMFAKGHLHPVQKGFISFSNTVTNVSVHLVPAFGVFMCVQPGVYQFTMSAATQQRVPFRIAIKLNRDTVATMYGSPNDYQQVSQTAVVQLNSGDFVYPFVEVGDIFESAIQDRAYTVFSGFQIGTGGATNDTGSNTSRVGEQRLRELLLHEQALRGQV